MNLMHKLADSAEVPRCHGTPHPLWLRQAKQIRMFEWDLTR